jgi:hypothetical protein
LRDIADTGANANAWTTATYHKEVEAALEELFGELYLLHILLQGLSLSAMSLQHLFPQCQPTLKRLHHHPVPRYRMLGLDDRRLNIFNGLQVLQDLSAFRKLRSPKTERSHRLVLLWRLR